MSSPPTTAQTSAKLSSNILHLCSSLRSRSLMRQSLEDFGFCISDLSSLFSICQRSLLSYSTSSDVLTYLESHEISDRIEEEIWILNRRIKLVRPKVKSLRGVRLEWMARIRWSGFRLEVESLKCDMEGVKSLLILVLLVMNLEEEISEGREIEIKETKDQLKSTTRTLLHTQNRSVASPDFHATGRDRIFALQDTILQLSEHMAKHGTIPAPPTSSSTHSTVPPGKRKKKTSSKKSSERLKKRRRQEAEAGREPAVGVTFRPQRQPPSIVDFPLAEPHSHAHPPPPPPPQVHQGMPYPSSSSVAAAAVQMPEMPPVRSSSVVQHPPSRPSSTVQQQAPSRPSSTVQHPPSRPSSTVQFQPPPSRPSSTVHFQPPPSRPSSTIPPQAPPPSRPSSAVPPIIVVHDADTSIPPQIISPRSSNHSRYAAYVSDEPDAPSSSAPPPPPPPTQPRSPSPSPAPAQIREGWINGQRARALLMEDLEDGNFITESYARTLPGVAIAIYKPQAHAQPQPHQKGAPPPPPPPFKTIQLDGTAYESFGSVSFRWTEDEHRGNSFTVHCDVIRQARGERERARDGEGSGSVVRPDLIFGRPFVRKRGRYIA